MKFKNNQSYGSLFEVTYLKSFFRGTGLDIWTLFLVLSGYACPPVVEVPKSETDSLTSALLRAIPFKILIIFFLCLRQTRGMTNKKGGLKTSDYVLMYHKKGKLLVR